MASLKVGEALPDLELPGLDGEEHSLSTHWAGAGCVYVVGHSDCATTRLILPFAARLAHGATTGTRVRVVLQDEPAAAASLLDELGADVPTLLDPAPYPLGAGLGLASAPTLVHVSGEGRVLRVVEGFERTALEQIARELGLEEPFFRPDDDVPTFRPG